MEDDDDSRKVVAMTICFITIITVVVFGMACLAFYIRSIHEQDSYRQCVADGFGPVCVDILKPSSR